jgi:SAM-dependent methyltransferase
MAEANTAPTGRYILDGSDEDLRRLLGLSQLTAESARRAFRRADLRAGQAAIDCGCGPIGGLDVLAEMVGPAGRVVGIDFSESAIGRARSATAALGLLNVELIAGDINQVDPATLGGPFDLAFTRHFLVHQADPAKTLSQVAGLLRPGGRIVMQEPLASPPPRSYPHLSVLGASWDLLVELAVRAGAVHAAAERLPRTAREAGLEVVAAEGFFLTLEPELGFELHAATLAATAGRAAKLGIAAETIDDLVQSLRAAKAGGYDWVTTPFYLDLILRKPDMG